MPQTDIAAKARRLLARRNASNGLWFYLKLAWKMQLLAVSAGVAIPAALWWLDFEKLAVAFGCYFAGAKIRDFRWWSVLSKEWPTTSLFVDWAKVESIANGGPAD